MLILFLLHFKYFNIVADVGSNSIILGSVNAVFGFVPACVDVDDNAVAAADIIVVDSIKFLLFAVVFPFSFNMQPAKHIIPQYVFRYCLLWKHAQEDSASQ